MCECMRRLEWGGERRNPRTCKSYQKQHPYKIFLRCDTSVPWALVHFLKQPVLISCVLCLLVFMRFSSLIKPQRWERWLVITCSKGPSPKLKPGIHESKSILSSMSHEGKWVSAALAVIVSLSTGSRKDHSMESCSIHPASYFILCQWTPPAYVSTLTSFTLTLTLTCILYIL